MKEISKNFAANDHQQIIYSEFYKDNILYLTQNRIFKYDLDNAAKVLVKDLNAVNNDILDIAAYLEDTLLVLESGSKCVSSMDLTAGNAFNSCNKKHASASIRLIAPINLFQYFILDSNSKVWWLYRDIKLQLSAGYKYNCRAITGTAEYMVADPHGKNVYISTSSGVWKCGADAPKPEMILPVGNSANDGELSAATIRKPGDLLFLSRDVLLVIDVGSENVKVLDLKSGYASSICRAGNVAGRLSDEISDCVLQKPRHLVYQPNWDNGVVLIGGNDLKAITLDDPLKTRKLD